MGDIPNKMDHFGKHFGQHFGDIFEDSEKDGEYQDGILFISSGEFSGTSSKLLSVSSPGNLLVDNRRLTIIMEELSVMDSSDF